MGEIVLFFSCTEMFHVLTLVNRLSSNEQWEQNKSLVIRSTLGMILPSDVGITSSTMKYVDPYEKQPVFNGK